MTLMKMCSMHLNSKVCISQYIKLLRFFFFFFFFLFVCLLLFSYRLTRPVCTDQKLCGCFPAGSKIVGGKALTRMCLVRCKLSRGETTFSIWLYIFSNFVIVCSSSLLLMLREGCVS